MTDDDDELDDFDLWLCEQLQRLYPLPPGWAEGLRTFEELCEAIGLDLYAAQDSNPRPEA